jgi:hypothetical protein
MRQSKATNKKLGYIVVPLFIEQKKGETEAEAFTRSGFDEVAEVLGAMLESDDDLVDTIEKMQEARGRGDKFNPRQLHEKIEVIGPAINLDKLTQSIEVEILDCLGVSWDRWFGLLQRFHTREGHCFVPQRSIEDGLALGTWTNRQRRFKELLSLDRINRLTEIGFIWDATTERWENAFSALKDFRKTQGHCRVPVTYKANGLRLGAWVATQRQIKNRITPDHLKRLNEIGFIWDPFDVQWNEAFSKLLTFHKREGHCRVPNGHLEEGLKLGSWVGEQRLKKEGLTPDRIKRLNEINFSWEPLAEQWEEGFASLIAFHKLNGHCRVAQSEVFNGTKLGVWVSGQRTRKQRLAAEQIRRLDSIGFSWDPQTEKWDAAFEMLQDYWKINGHCNVTQTQNVRGFKLGSWVITQRHKKNKLTPQRIMRLNSIGFSWDPLSEQWDKAYSLLKAFHKREGHSRVPESHIEEQFRLGSWVKTQRARKDKQTPARIRQLESVSFIWKAR